MKTFRIKLSDGPYQDANNLISVNGDIAQILPDGALVIKTNGENVVFMAASGRWNYYEVQSYQPTPMRKQA